MNRTKTPLYLIAAVFACLTLAGCNPTNDSGGHSTLVVDISAVAKALGRDAQMQKQLEDAHTVLNSQLLQITTDLTEQLEQEKSGNQSAEELKQLSSAVDLKIAQTQQLARNKADNYRIALIKGFIDEVRTESAKIGRQRHATVVTLLTPETIWFDASADITDEVIAAFRARQDPAGKAETVVAPETSPVPSQPAN